MIVLTALFAGPETGWHRGLLDVPTSIVVMLAALGIIGTALFLTWKYR